MNEIMYTVVIPSKDYKNTTQCVTWLIVNSDFCQEILIFWNGSDSDYTKLCEWISEKNFLKCNTILMRDDVYKLYNHGVEIAKNDLVLLINDDMYVPPSWDTPLMDVLSTNPAGFSNSVITTQLVESGYVDVNKKNIQIDYGRTWEDFDFTDFDTYNVSYYDSHEAFQLNFGWYMPVFVHKKWFLEFGKYPTQNPFPYPNDIEFFNKVLVSEKIIPIQINSCVYHFQRLSQRTNGELLQDLPTKLNLCCGDDIRDGYLNADSIVKNPSVMKIDLINGGLDKFPDDHFEEILFYHALEHFRFHTGKRILEKLYHKLRSGGTLFIAVPDLQKACFDFVSGHNRQGCADPIMRIYGQNTSEELVHRSGYTEATLFLLLQEIGFMPRILDPRYDDEIYFEAIR